MSQCCNPTSTRSVLLHILCGQYVIQDKFLVVVVDFAGCYDGSFMKAVNSVTNSVRYTDIHMCEKFRKLEGKKIF